MEQQVSELLVVILKKYVSEWDYWLDWEQRWQLYVEWWLQHLTTIRMIMESRLLNKMAQCLIKYGSHWLRRLLIHKIFTILLKISIRVFKELNTGSWKLFSLNNHLQKHALEWTQDKQVHCFYKLLWTDAD